MEEEKRMPYIAVCLVLVALLAVMPVMATESSVSLGGHTFTANLPDGWVTDKELSSDVGALPEGDNSLDPIQAVKGIGTWTGVSMFAPWYYPADDGGYNSMACLYVVKIPDELKGQDTTKILTAAAPSFDTEIKANHITGYSDKDITFGGRPAHLAECEWFEPAASFGAPYDQGTTGRIAILFDADTVGVIYVWIDHTATGSYYNGRAWDIINSITVT